MEHFLHPEQTEEEYSWQSDLGLSAGLFHKAEYVGSGVSQSMFGRLIYGP